MGGRHPQHNDFDPQNNLIIIMPGLEHNLAKVLPALAFLSGQALNLERVGPEESAGTTYGSSGNPRGEGGNGVQGGGRRARGTGYENQRVVNVAGARENVGHVSRECQKPKRAKDAAYHKEKMLLCKQEEAGVQFNAEQADWKDDTEDESDDQGTWHRFKRVLQTLLTILDPSLMLSHCIRKQDDQDDTDELDQERDLLASLIEKLKCEIDDNKNRNKFLESSN
ncbi:hypothetical protein Tco_0979320 [Tanacetum coccineum]